MPSIEKVLKIDNLLAVVADTFPDKAFVVLVLASPKTAAAGLFCNWAVVESYLS